MKHKVSELEGALLDAAVAAAGCLSWQMEDRGLGLMCSWLNPDAGWKEGPLWMLFQPSLDWRYGGPIIERERIDIGHNGALWTAHCAKGFGTGGSALIAAMRAYAASKFGEEVELP